MKRIIMITGEKYFLCWDFGSFLFLGTFLLVCQVGFPKQVPPHFTLYHCKMV